MQAGLTVRAHEPLAWLALLALQTWCGLGSRIITKSEDTLLGDGLGSNAHVEGLDVGGKENLNNQPPAPPTQTAMMETGKEMNNYYSAAQDSLDYEAPWSTSRRLQEPAAWARHILGLSADASVPEMTKAYNGKWRYWHPDRVQKYPDKSKERIIVTDRFQEVQMAYSILTEQLPSDIKAELHMFDHRRREGGAGSKQKRSLRRLKQAEQKRVDEEPRQAGPEAERRRQAEAAQRPEQAKQKQVEEDLRQTDPEAETEKEMSDYHSPTPDSLDSEPPWSRSRRLRDPVAWARYILGLSTDTSVPQIIKAYKDKCRFWRPDRVQKYPDKWKERVIVRNRQEVQTAYSILTEQLPPDIKETQGAVMETGKEMNNYFSPAQDSLDSKAPWSQSHRSQEPADWARYILGLPTEAQVPEIRKAYEDKCRYWHPDRVRWKAEIHPKERFQEIQTAYSILTEQLLPDIKVELGKSRRRECEIEARRRGRRSEHAKQRRLEEELRQAAPEEEQAKQKRVEEDLRQAVPEVQLEGEAKPARRLEHAEQKQVEEELRQVAPEAEQGREAKAAPRAASHLDVGIFVVAKGLKEAAHLNGKSGIIKSFDEDEGRYWVNFEERDAQELLKPDNIDFPWSLA